MAPVERFNYDGILYRLNRLPREFFFLSLSPSSSSSWNANYERLR